MNPAAECYRDPVYDGATDPKVIIDQAGGWWMFYTQRRATHPDPGPGVAWVHGSRIGVAQSADGVQWRFAGTLEPSPDGAVLGLDAAGPPAAVERTHWAPEVVFDGACWRMYLTEIDGIPDRWPGFARHIVEYRSSDLAQWRRIGALPLPGERAIDAAVANIAPAGAAPQWRLWYKDEAADSTTAVAASADLESWHVLGTAIGGRAHEGPDVFRLGGCWWMLVDEWRGMGVFRSDDAVTWTRQGGPDDVVLGAGSGPGGGFGHHGALVHDGTAAWFYFFGHVPGEGEAADADPAERRRCAVARAGVRVDDGRLRVDAIEAGAGRHSG